MQRILNDRRLLLPALLVTAAIAAAAVLIVVLNGSGSDGSAAPTAASQATASGPVTIDIADFTFKPEAITVRRGTRLTWVNHDVAQHTATANGAFDTGTLQKGDRKSITLSKAGTYAYVCQFHPFMKATVTVR
jgi:plastocyanin